MQSNCTTVLLHERLAVDVPVLDGIHHIKIPVTDLNRSRSWYASRLGYELEIEFVEQGMLMGIGLVHPAGGPRIALRLDPERSAGLGDFDFFSIGVLDKASIESLAERLTNLGEAHAGVHFAGVGWILPGLHDPDGHEVRFYTTERHTHTGPERVTRVEGPVETSLQREREHARTQATP